MGGGGGGMRATLRDDGGSDKASGDGSTVMGDPEERKVVVACISRGREVYPSKCPGF